MGTIGSRSSTRVFVTRMLVVVVPVFVIRVMGVFVDGVVVSSVISVALVSRWIRVRSLLFRTAGFYAAFITNIFGQDGCVGVVVSSHCDLRGSYARSLFCVFVLCF